MIERSCIKNQADRTNFMVEERARTRGARSGTFRALSTFSSRRQLVRLLCFRWCLENPQQQSRYFVIRTTFKLFVICALLVWLPSKVLPSPHPFPSRKKRNVDVFHMSQFLFYHWRSQSHNDLKEMVQMKRKVSRTYIY